MRQRFISTRGGARYTFKEAVLAGWAGDGGMILPETLPTISLDMLRSWRTRQDLKYSEVVVDLLQLFMGEEAFPGLPELVHQSFATFTTPNVVELRPLSKHSRGGSMYVAELFHGPSLAFKDLGMQVLCRLLEHYLAEDRKSMVFLVGTSGDTGPSALEAVKGKAGMDIVVLYPLGRVSPTQEAQMLDAHQSGDNCHVVAVEGTSDDLDEPCAEVFMDAAFREQHGLGTLNSVNIVRLLVQVFHYFYIYISLTKHHPAWDNIQGDSTSSLPKVSFVVPTGAAGHVTAGVIAILMGLPIQHLIMATNDNDILDIMMREGYLQKKSAVVATNSPAMDIQSPYNIERILALLGETPSKVRAMMEAFNAGNRLDIPAQVMGKLRDMGVGSATVTRSQTLQIINKMYGEESYLLDPHTAVGLGAYQQLGFLGQEGPVVCMGCAHPAKFTETIAQALHIIDISQALNLIAATSAPQVGRTLGLVKSLGGHASCPRFRKEDRSNWTGQLKQVISSISGP